MSDTLYSLSPDGTVDWLAYWEKQEQLWRREPEIDFERQQYFTKRLENDGKQSAYPFQGAKLSRADVEWLLATLESSVEPWASGDKSQQEENTELALRDAGRHLRGGNIHYRKRQGRWLDLRGAILQYVDLSDLPLAPIRAGLTVDTDTLVKQRDGVAVNLKGADLRGTYLVGAELRGADLSEALLLRGNLEEADLQEANLERADLRQANLERANLFAANLERANLQGTNLSSACLQEVRMDAATRLAAVRFDNKMRLGDVSWNGVSLTQVDWQQVSVLGDEIDIVKAKNRTEAIRASHNAVRANRQLAITLRAQGMDEYADRFSYRAYVLQRQLLLRGGKFGQYLLSLFLDILTGYGYKPGRSILAYLVVVAGFAVAYYLLGQITGPVLSPFGAAIFSIASFLGRGFFPPGTTLDNPITAVAAIEALVGLIIEISFIVAFVRRFFTK